MSRKLKESLQQILSREVGTIRKPHGSNLRVALAYPNTYYIGMSNLGLHSVYEIFNLDEETTCERVFVPDKGDEAELERTRGQLLSLETQTPLREFDVIAITVSFETDYANIPKILRLSNIPYLSAERNEYHPLIVIGGAAAFLNPEPIAEFADIVTVGEGEILIPRLLKFIKEAESRDQLLQTLSQERGFYVPRYYQFERNEDGTTHGIIALDGAAPRVLRVRAEMPKQNTKLRNDLIQLTIGPTLKLATADGQREAIKARAFNVSEFEKIDVENGDRLKFVGNENYAASRVASDYVPATVVLSDDTEMSSRFLIEISRGCSEGCRFCWAGFSYLPPRIVPAKLILEAARKARQYTDKVGLVATAVCDHPEITDILYGLRDMKYNISVSSLRLDQISPELLDALVEAKDQQLAVAPETGSERLRHMINKNMSNAEVIDICSMIFERGILNLKLYMMVGLPTETDDDLNKIKSLGMAVREKMMEAGKRFGRVGKLIISLNGFVPKPHTPLQWAPMETEKGIERRLKYVEKLFRGVPNVEIRSMSARIAHQQALLSLGDRRMTNFLIELDKGANWREALRNADVEASFFTTRGRETNEFLPWNIVDNGLDDGFMLKEWHKAMESRITPPCPATDNCTRCGVC